MKNKQKNFILKRNKDFGIYSAFNDTFLEEIFEELLNKFRIFQNLEAFESFIIIIKKVMKNFLDIN